MITELLSNYEKSRNNDTSYEILDLVDTGSGEAAWIKSTTEIRYLNESGEQATEILIDCGLYCECYFTEGVGWMYDEGNHFVTIGTHDKCRHIETAIDIRAKELRKEYIERFSDEDSDTEEVLINHIEEIVFDMIERDKRNEFIAERGSGAHSYGGHFYLGTLAKVLNVDQPSLYSATDRLQKDKKISLDGFVVQEYTPTLEPDWFEAFKYNRDGFTVVAYMPYHSKMGQSYKLVLHGDDGKYLNIEYIPLSFSIYGPDVDDELRARKRCVDMISEALNKQ